MYMYLQIVYVVGETLGNRYLLFIKRNSIINNESSLGSQAKQDFKFKVALIKYLLLHPYGSNNEMQIK